MKQVILGPHKPRTILDRVLRRTPPDFDIPNLPVDELDAVIGLVATPLLDALLARRPNVPVFHVTDATPTFLRESYGWSVPETADAAERRVVERATATVYSSNAMVERAARDLGLSSIRAHALPFGININRISETPPQKPGLRRLNLLFVGLDWVRKGGDIAVAALDRIRESGQPAHLTIVGQGPKTLQDHPAVTHVGFLDKNRARDAAHLNQLYRQAHLLLLPSRGDCTPMVIGEAMSHGTPVVASDTGGIASLVGGNGAGQVMPQFATPEAWADAIRDLTRSPDVYRMMSDAAFDRARTTLSWSTWAKEMAGLVLDAMTTAPKQSAA